MTGNVITFEDSTRNTIGFAEVHDIVTISNGKVVPTAGRWSVTPYFLVRMNVIDNSIKNLLHPTYEVPTAFVLVDEDFNFYGTVINAKSKTMKICNDCGTNTIFGKMTTADRDYIIEKISRYANQS